MRRVLSASWSTVEHDRTDGLLRFEIRGTAFCHQMVRSIVGTLVDVGRGRRHAGDVAAILAARYRACRLGPGAAARAVPVGGRLPGLRRMRIVEPHRRSP